MCAKIQDVITSHFEYELLYQHMPIINRYTVRGILCAYIVLTDNYAILIFYHIVTNKTLLVT